VTRVQVVEVLLIEAFLFATYGWAMADILRLFGVRLWLQAVIVGAGGGLMGSVLAHALVPLVQVSG
jgi:hypothetical protein